MKKENQKLTLQQLKRIRKNAAIIVLAIYLIGFVSIVFIGPILAKKITEINIDKFNLIILFVMFFSVTSWMFFGDLHLGIKIRDEEEKLKVTKIKNNAKKGNLKSVIVVKSENIQNEILSSNIEKILFKGKNKDLLVLEIYFKNGFCLPINLQEEIVLSILNQKQKEKIFENIIESITIEDLEKSTMQVKIDTKGKIITERADNYNLLGWFELKE